MANEWVDHIRQIVLQAVDAGDPCDIMTGTVARASPVSVQIDQKTILTPGQLIVPEHLRDHTANMVIPGIGDVMVTVKNNLRVGDTVLLIQQKGAQRYLIVGRF